MADISTLEGINSDEVNKLCGAQLSTVEEFLACVEPNFEDGIRAVSGRTGITPERLIQLLPLARVPVHLLPDEWIVGVTKRVLRTEAYDPWRKRCKFGLQRFGRGLKGHWRGWKDNLPIFVLLAGMLLLLVLTLRAAGGLQWLPSPVGLHAQALVTADDLDSEKSDRVLKPDDLYPALLPPESDYFKPGDKLDGLVLARSVSARTPLRFSHVLRQQVVAARDVQANAVIRRADITLAWTTYQPGAALSLEEVCGRQALQAIRKDGVILSRLVNPEPKAPPAPRCE
ncbi:MAG TPA: SAF domain-containing protein [Pyrinomonadaceae bacterium]|nr:SAF domain-containing protein [Pyrinomonadaceae bacterium]